MFSVGRGREEGDAKELWTLEAIWRVDRMSTTVNFSVGSNSAASALCFTVPSSSSWLSEGSYELSSRDKKNIHVAPGPTLRAPSLARAKLEFSRVNHPRISQRALPSERDWAELPSQAHCLIYFYRAPQMLS